MFNPPSVPVDFYKNQLDVDQWEILEELLAELRLLNGNAVVHTSIMSNNRKLTGISIEKHIQYVPSTISELDYLTTLMVSTDIPPNLTKLRNLTTLSIQNITDPEFPPHYSSLKKLQFLFLHSNNLYSFPSFIRHLQNLTYLDISNNHITAIPDFIQSLSKLQTLILNNNKISVIHPGIGQLKKIQKISLKNNRIKTIPSTFSLLFSLTEIDLTNNPLDHSVIKIFQLPNLKTVNINNSIRIRYAFQLPEAQG